MAKAAGGNARGLFEFGLPAVKPLIQTPEDLRTVGSVLIEMAKTPGGNAGGLFEFGLPAVKHLIQTPEDLRIVGSVLIEMAKTPGGNAWGLFEFGLPAVKHLIQTPEDLRTVGSDLAKMAKAVGWNARGLFEFGLPAVKPIIQTPEDLRTVGSVLIEMAKTPGGNAGGLFEFGLPAVKHLIQTPEDLRIVGSVLIEMAKTPGWNAGGLFEFGLPAVKHLIQTPEDLRIVGSDLAKMAKIPGGNARGLFEFGLPAVKHLIQTLEDLRAFVKLSDDFERVILIAEVAKGFKLPLLGFEDIDAFESNIKKARLEIRGGFDKNNAWHLAANYYEIRLEEIASEETRPLTVERYRSLVNDPATASQEVEKKHRIELKALAYESYRFMYFLDQLREQANKEGREVVVIANKTYGAMALTPLRVWLEDQGIKVIETKIGSSSAHGNPLVMDFKNRQLFNDNQIGIW